MASGPQEAPTPLLVGHPGGSSFLWKGGQRVLSKAQGGKSLPSSGETKNFAGGSEAAPAVCHALPGPAGGLVSSLLAAAEDGLPQCPRGPWRQRPLPARSQQEVCCPRLLGLCRARRIEPQNKITSSARKVLEDPLPQAACPQLRGAGLQAEALNWLPQQEGKTCPGFRAVSRHCLPQPTLAVRRPGSSRLCRY